MTPFIMASIGVPASEPCICLEKMVSLTESNQVSGSRTERITLASG